MTEFTVTGFRQVPPFARGIVRDLRVRWALEEAGLPYEVDLVDPSERKAPAYLRKQPFGMVPAAIIDGTALFESGAIVQLVAEESEALMPTETAPRREVVVWMHAALNTLEPPLDALFALDMLHGAESWAPARRPGLVETVRDRLAVVAGRLEGRAYLVDRFSAADILMASVLRLAGHTDLSSADPVLGPYLARCEGRPAFRAALDSQLADYARHEPAGA